MEKRGLDAGRQSGLGLFGTGTGPIVFEHCGPGIPLGRIGPRGVSGPMDRDIFSFGPLPLGQNQII